MRTQNTLVLVVSGGNHVTVLVDAAGTGSEFDLIEVLAGPGGGPPAHQHEVVECFHVLEGELQRCEERDGTIVPTVLLREGETAVVSSWE